MRQDELKAAQLALIENIQREDLNPIEEAMAYAELIRTYGMKQEDAARQLGKSRSAVANAVRLLDLPDDVLELIKSGKLSAGHGRTLLGRTINQRAPACGKIVKRNLSVREAGASVKRENRSSSSKVPNDMPYSITVDYLADLEHRAMTASGRRIKIRSNGHRRHVEIDYSDNDDLEQLLSRICGTSLSEQ